MLRQHPPTFAACSSRFGRLFLPVCFRADVESGVKQAQLSRARVLIRESEEAAKGGVGSSRETRRRREPKRSALRSNGAPRSRRLRFSAKRRTNPLPSFGFPERDATDRRLLVRR
jgi:hypothetical protein